MRNLLWLLLLALPPLAAVTYDIGPGQTYTSIDALPWESLGPGDIVRIHYSATPYRSHFVIAAQGTQPSPITITGVLGPGGERPVITGDAATTRAQLDYWNDERGVLKIGGASVPNQATAKWIVVENLHVTAGRPAYAYTDGAGAAKSHAGNCAAIYLEQGQNITIRNCEITDSANGLFVAAGDLAGGNRTQNILVERCYIHDNGEVADGFVHNNYSEADGITFQYNRFGPLRAGCPGNNLKDRSAGCVVRYNWIESGNRQLDLVDSDYFFGQPNYATTFVYGNVLIEPDGAGNSQIIHYGGDGVVAQFRKGTLHLYNNTVVSTRSGNTTLIRLSTNSETCDCRNNVIYNTANGANMALIDDTGIFNYRNCWFKTGYVNSHNGGSPAGTINNLGNNVTGTAPGFVSEAGQDFMLALGSACIDAGAALDAARLPANLVVRHYVKHQQDAARPADATLDIGTFEFDSGSPPLVPAAPTGVAAWGFGGPEVVVRWMDASNNESGFRIERRPAGSATFSAVGTVIANETQFDDTNVTHGLSYDYRVFAFNAAGDSAPSNVATVSWVHVALTGDTEGCEVDPGTAGIGLSILAAGIVVVSLLARRERRRSRKPE